MNESASSSVSPLWGSLPWGQMTSYSSTSGKHHGLRPCQGLAMRLDMPARSFQLLSSPFDTQDRLQLLDCLACPNHTFENGARDTEQPLRPV